MSGRQIETGIERFCGKIEGALKGFSFRKVTRRSVYIPMFMMLSITFVPVIFFFGLIVLIVPSGYGIVWLLDLIFMKQDWRLGIGVGLHLLVYLTFFLLLARVSHRLLTKIPWEAARLIACALIFAALIGCGFLRVLTYQSIQGCGGTYTFWTAVERYLEKRHGRS